HGFVDVRLVAPSDERGWLDGGFGKTRYGDDSDALVFGGAALVLDWQLAPEWLAHLDVQAHPDDGFSVEAMEGWLRWRPVSTSPWRWSAKAGEFFVPGSIENQGIGWTSLWTITPSAINSWMGEEFRAIGGEVRIEHRFERGAIELAGAFLRANDPAGEVLASRGWSFSDRTFGWQSEIRQPDAASFGSPLPFRSDSFLEVDGNWGWYADLTWRGRGDDRATLVRYDNRADPSASTELATRELYAWETDYWSLGVQKRVGDVTLVAQGMDGETIIAFDDGPPSTTDFSAAFLLAAFGDGEWQPAVRYDWFRTTESPPSPNPRAERGNALTAALNWRPRDWLRLTGEALWVHSVRGQRRDAGLDAEQDELQVQVMARFLF
ncbi:MAG TPA: hypothetical protein VFL14_07240, partial [Xanthomonadales bacterium]|nr:hypothetical protein [Xanthomonadales bacterium]